MRVFDRLALKPFKTTMGGNKRYKSLTGKHGIVVSAINPRGNHVARIARVWPYRVVVCDTVMRDITPICVEWVAVARFYRAMRGETEMHQAWGTLETIPMVIDEAYHFQRVNVLEYPQPFAIPPTNTTPVRVRLTHG